MAFVAPGCVSSTYACPTSPYARGHSPGAALRATCAPAGSAGAAGAQGLKQAEAGSLHTCAGRGWGPSTPPQCSSRRTSYTAPLVEGRRQPHQPHQPGMPYGTVIEEKHPSALAGCTVPGLIAVRVPAGACPRSVGPVGPHYYGSALYAVQRSAALCICCTRRVTHRATETR